MNAHAPSTNRVPEELVDFFEAGVGIQLGTCDPALRPECTRAVGALVSRDRSRLTVYLNQATAGRAVANLATHRQVAVCFSRPIDHRSVQVKGRAVATRMARDDERATVERYISSFVEALYLIGITRATTKRIARWPSTAVEVEIESFFHQTPGPGAGRKLES